MSNYVCPNCGDAIVLEGDEPPPKLYAFCFECGEWVDFEKEKPMDINVSCEKCGDGLKVVRQWTDRGNIEITVMPCEYCLRQQQEPFPKCTDSDAEAERCPKCGGTVGHRINCPDGIAFSRPASQVAKEQNR